MKTFTTLLLLALFVSVNAYSQDTLPKSQGYLSVQMINYNGKTSVINISTPSGESRQIECLKVPLAFASSEVIKETIAKNFSKLLEVLESYRKNGYELQAVSNEYSGYVNNYLLLKK